ncbi:TetR/AcrR family transcriptional regulator [Phyllobacterium sp. 0TCS1.6C]|uniref:TetR/AcrR family transcriptional regulator n=1 Tax=unclassified Phyllobacterium TaxID=2638441 RepID=UPI002264251F|nr:MULTISPECIES: TetR/AcrR family transcriptional regulator [unclassified Phyllobacterium]MCX8279193.1 TetR/AcrR family transcriptional regulator [Phyllobacterium sp. 0TCS1.6C]MCX8293977.1 TetR/AcrR family transcriptional regulator [Phyllobacterium sp. 0TCS1.6A]
MMTNSKEAILAAARQIAQSHGYSGLNFRDLAAQVGIKAASIYHHFPSKAGLGAAVARRYWEDTKSELDTLLDNSVDAIGALREYPGIFRRSLESDNRLCLCSFMSAEYDDLPQEVTAEVQTFAEINVAWISRALVAAGAARAENSDAQARAIFAAVAGAQLMARSRSDISMFDALIESYQTNGLLPA